LVVLLVSLSSCSSQQVAGFLPRTARAFSFNTLLSPNQQQAQTINPTQLQRFQFNPTSVVPNFAPLQFSLPNATAPSLTVPNAATPNSAAGWPWTPIFQQNGVSLNNGIPVVRASDNLFFTQQTVQQQQQAAVQPLVPAVQDEEQARSLSANNQQNNLASSDNNNLFNFVPNINLFTPQQFLQQPQQNQQPFIQQQAQQPLQPAFIQQQQQQQQQQPAFPQQQFVPQPEPVRRRPFVQPTPPTPAQNNFQVEDQTPILKYINEQNDDGSYTYGFESADGTYKIETRLPSGEVAGKYGYLDSLGVLKEVTYGAGNEKGFVPNINSFQDIPDNVGITQQSPVNAALLPRRQPIPQVAQPQPQPQPALSSQEGEVLAAFSSLMEVARGTSQGLGVNRPVARPAAPATPAPFNFLATTTTQKPVQDRLRILNGRKLVMKRRRKPDSNANPLRRRQNLSTTQSTTQKPTQSSETVITTSKSSVSSSRSSIIASKNAPHFPPRDFMDRFKDVESNSVESESGRTSRRFKIRRRKLDIFKADKNSDLKKSQTTRRSSSGRSLPFFETAEFKHHTNAHQAPDSFISDVNLSTGSYRISYG